MAQKVLVITSGTEAAGVGITYMAQVRAHPSSRLHTMVCSLDTDNLSTHYTGFRDDEWMHLSIPARHISTVRRDPDSDPILKEILYDGIMPEIAGSGGGSVRYNTAGAIIINRELVKSWLRGHMTNLIASDDGQNNLQVVIVVSAVGATGSGTLERLMNLVISVAQDVRIPEPIPLDVFVLQPGTTNVSPLNLANTVALYLEGAASRLFNRTDADEDDLHSRPYRGRTILVDWGSTVTLETLSQLREAAATLIRVTHDPASQVAAEFQRTEVDHNVLRALDVRTNLPSYLSAATPVTITLGNLEEQITQRDAVRLVNYVVLGDQSVTRSADVLLADADITGVTGGILVDSLTHFLQGNNADERYEHLVEVLTQDVALLSLQNTAARLERRTAPQQAQKLRADWQADREHIPSLADDIRQKGSELVHQTFQLIDVARRKGVATTLSLRELRMHYRAMRQIVAEVLNIQPYGERIKEQQVLDELEKLARTRFGAPRPQAAIAAIQTNLRGMVQRSSHTIAQAVLRAVLNHCDEALRDLGLVLARITRQFQSDTNWQMVQQPLVVDTHHPLEIPALAPREVDGYADLVSIFSSTRQTTTRSNFENLLHHDQTEELDPLAAFRKWLEDEGKLNLLFTGNVKELYKLAFTYAKKYIHGEIMQHSVLTILQRAGDGVLQQRIRDAVARAQIMVPIDRSFAPELEEKLLISAHWEDAIQGTEIQQAVREVVKRTHKLLPSDDPSEIIIFYFADGIPMSATNDLTSRCLEQFLYYRSRWHKQHRQSTGDNPLQGGLRVQRAGIPVYSGQDAEKRVLQTGVLYALYRVRRQNIGRYTAQDIPELVPPTQADQSEAGSVPEHGAPEASDEQSTPAGGANGTAPNVGQDQARGVV
jgi:hypothetical protein